MRKILIETNLYKEFQSITILCLKLIEYIMF